MSGPYLGLDIGLKRTGTSLSESGITARPLKIVESAYPHLEPLYKGIISLCTLHSPTTLIIGLPNHADGSQSPQAHRVIEISEELQRRLPAVAVAYWDEHGSTKAAKKEYPDLDDNLGAATLILQEYLDSL